MAGYGLIPCDLCGTPNPTIVLECPALDGPLVKCASCGLRYVGERPSALAFGSEAAEIVLERVRGANRAFHNLPAGEERRLALLNARWRLDLIRGVRPSGRLLEVGCARGDFLGVAREVFDVYGVEPNPELAEAAARIAPVHSDVVETAPWRDFDVVACFHVIEHVASPRRFVRAMRERLKPGGTAVIETPNIQSLPFRIFGKRWRQFIPEHYFFFDPATLTRLCNDEGLKVERTIRIGKYASVPLILNRLSRYAPWIGRMGSLGGMSRLAFRINPGDVMLLIATRPA